MAYDEDDYFDQEVVEDYVPPPRQGIHTEPELCKAVLRTATASFPLSVRSSGISPGSGLFVDKLVEPGFEIYRSKPLMSAIDVGNPSFCHFCLRDTSAAVQSFSIADTQNGEPVVSEAKACMGCKVARFCSKKCQKLAWQEFHKDECRTLKNVPKMKAQHLLVHRLIFWQQRGGITTSQGKIIEQMETHFWDYSNDGERNGEIMDMGMAIRRATGNKVDSGLTWRLVPAFRTNCVRIRPASKKESVGAALDFVTSTINHSCDPNAFVFVEGNHLWVRSLKRIPAGGEITICYLDPTVDLVNRKKLLKRDHFFDCDCTRCKAEEKETKALIKAAKITNSDTFHAAQREILEVINTAVVASRYPGLHPTYEDIGNVETQLRTITSRTFPSGDPFWPDHLDPLPSARLSVSTLYLNQGRLGPALRSALRGKLMSKRRSGPEYVNEMLDFVVFLLLKFGNLEPDAARKMSEDSALPTFPDMMTVLCGYLYEACKEAGKVFGGDSAYTKGICDMLAVLVRKKVAGNSEKNHPPGSNEFEKEFDAAQGRLMAWAAIPTSYRIVL